MCLLYNILLPPQNVFYSTKSPNSLRRRYIDILLLVSDYGAYKKIILTAKIFFKKKKLVDDIENFV